MYDEQIKKVYQDKVALEDEYRDILNGSIEWLDPLPLVGKINQSKITWQSNTTGCFVNPETGEVIITKSNIVQEVILFAIIEHDDYVEICEFRFTIPANS